MKASRAIKLFNESIEKLFGSIEKQQMKAIEEKIKKASMEGNRYIQVIKSEFNNTVRNKLEKNGFKINSRSGFVWHSVVPNGILFHREPDFYFISW